MPPRTDTAARLVLIEEALERVEAQLAQDDAMRKALEDALFYTQQLSSIMQGTRDDILAMRMTLRRLAALLEQVLQARVADEEWEQGKVDRRRLEDRRRAG